VCVYADAGFAVRNCVRVRRLHMRTRGRTYAARSRGRTRARARDDGSLWRAPSPPTRPPHPSTRMYARACADTHAEIARREKRMVDPRSAGHATPPLCRATARLRAAIAARYIARYIAPSTYGREGRDVFCKDRTKASPRARRGARFTRNAARFFRGRSRPKITDSFRSSP